MSTACPRGDRSKSWKTRGQRCPRSSGEILECTLEEVCARYSLMDIIGGHINVEEITIDSPVAQIVQNADGTSK